MALGNRKIPTPVARERWKKLFVYFLIVNTSLACAAGGALSMLIFVTLIVSAGAFELRRASAGFETHRFRIIVWLFYIAVSAATITMVPALSPANWVYLYLLVAVFDGFSQVVGQLLGRHRMSPRISPGKTIEGAIGGLLAALLVGVLFRDLAWPDPRAALILSFGIAVSGLGGDLLASWVKRRAGIKDFGAALPGQGGVLDRFDSFLAASFIVGPIIHFGGLT